MSARLKSLLWSTSGAVAPTVALSLFGLIAAGGIAFDYARLAGMDSELQTAADQAALAAAGQLDGKTGACSRAVRAASALLTNNTRFANDQLGLAVTIASEPSTCDAVGKVRFYQDKAKTTAATADANANFVELTVDARTAKYALTPIVRAYSSGSISAIAYAGVGQAICKQPPIMLCNPNEPSNNTNELYPFSGTTGQGMKLLTGSQAPGNFGWLQTAGGTGANALKAALAYDTPPGDCQPVTGVTTQTGQVSSALDAFNVRFDVYANGNSTCPNNPGGTCSPSQNTRKDLVCTSSSWASCSGSNNWQQSPNPYAPQNSTPLPTDGSQDPDIMGYPHDLCHSGGSTCPNANGFIGDGNWDRNAFFRVNYGWNNSQWTTALSNAGISSPASVSRYSVYKWEMQNPNNGGKGIADSQTVTGSGKGKGKGNTYYGFGEPYSGGINPLTSPIDRRRISVAVLNCSALNVNGKTTNVPVTQWLDVFLVEPAFARTDSSGNAYTGANDVYVEIIGTTNTSSTTSGTPQVIMRSVPYLIE